MLLALCRALAHAGRDAIFLSADIFTINVSNLRRFDVKFDFLPD